MEHQRFESMASNTNQHVTNHSATQAHAVWGSYGPVSWETDHGSVTGYLEHYDCESSSTLLLNIPTDAFHPWMLEGPPYGSPLSTCSSIGHTEGVCTPSYADMPTCSAVNLPVFEHVQSPPNSDAWSDEREPRWKLSNPGVPIWGPRQPSLPYQGRSACDQELLQRIPDYIVQSGPSSAPDSISYQAPVSSSAAGLVDSAPFQQDLAISPDVSEKDSDSESDSSDCENDSSFHGFSDSSTRQRGAKSRVMKLGRWGRIAYPFYTTIEPRHYRCSLADKKNPQNLCAKKFQRPEHLRRHVTTVHGNGKCHLCKVCPRPFSRRDNLREHYWTHLKRGGRAGKNTRMSLPELKAILGPKEKQLVKRLRRKLHNHQTRQTKARS
ncbi:hypothetical protein AA0119_g13117 [Alternaria tenuissima]|uniref:C2H2-type domain-containing protein n=1 Tax=Alternaria tenuissima TaxID=119927 RepID=A0ABY0FRF9_9PLEO|nr:hypothetical protein AA0119_g13117 [Alternaria tenuissima]